MPRRRMSALEAPSCSSNSPGSTMRRPSWPVKQSMSVGTSKRTRADSPARSATRANAFSSFTGRTIEASRSRT